MWVEYKHTLRRFRSQIIGWGIGLALYSLLMVSIYADIATINIDAFLENYPEEMLAFFGDSFWSLTSPEGYLDIYFFNYMTVIIGIFAVGAGAGLIIKDEQEGKLDLILSYPRSRTALFWARVAGYITVLWVILLIAWLSWVIPPGSSDLGISPASMLRPFLPLFCQLLFFGMLSLMLSMILPSVRLANLVAGGLLAANYLLVGLSNINQDLDQIVEFTPLNFYQGGFAIQGIDLDPLILVGEAALLCMILAWERFLNREIRVAGEGEWKLTFFGRGRKKSTRKKVAG